jgi:integrase
VRDSRSRRLTPSCGQPEPVSRTGASARGRLRQPPRPHPPSPAPLGHLDLEPARRFATAASSAATRRAYAREWSAFSAWCSSKHRVALPTLPATLAAYFAALAEGTATGRARKVAGIDLALAAIAAAHRAAGFDSPRDVAEVRAVRRGIRRELGTAQREAAPLLVPELRRALAALPATLHGARDRALLLLGWAGAFRRSALVGLDVPDLLVDVEGLAVTIRRDKTDQEARGRVLAIPFSSSSEVCPVRSVRAWLDAAGVSEGPIFRAVDRHGHVGAARLSDRAVALVVQRTVASIGLDATTFAGHSLRAGFATSAARAGKAERDIMRQTGHRSRAMLDRYVRAAQLWIDNPAAGLL